MFVDNQLLPEMNSAVVMRLTVCLCLSVCVFCAVSALTFGGPELETFICGILASSVFWYLQNRSSSYLKVTRSRSRSQEQKMIVSKYTHSRVVYL